MNYWSLPLCKVGNQWTPRSLSLYFLFQADILAQKTIHMVRRIRIIYFSKIVFPEAFLVCCLQYAVHLSLCLLSLTHPLSHTHTVTHRKALILLQTSVFAWRTQYRQSTYLKCYIGKAVCHPVSTLNSLTGMQDVVHGTMWLILAITYPLSSFGNWLCWQKQPTFCIRGSSGWIMCWLPSLSIHSGYPVMK